LIVRLTGEWHVVLHSNQPLPDRLHGCLGAICDDKLFHDFANVTFHPASKALSPVRMTVDFSIRKIRVSLAAKALEALRHRTAPSRVEKSLTIRDTLKNRNWI
jgi:hypothetical protein